MGLRHCLVRFSDPAVYLQLFTSDQNAFYSMKQIILDITSINVGYIIAILHEIEGSTRFFFNLISPTVYSRGQKF